MRKEFPLKKPASETLEDNSPVVSDENLRQFLGYNMKRAFLLVREDMTRAIEPLGLRMMTFSALAIVVENPDISQTQLSQALNLDRSGMVVLVDDLESADLISRNRVPGNRRAYALRATLKGQRVWKKADASVREHERKMFAEFGTDELERMRTILKTISSQS